MQALAAVKAQDAEADAELPQQALQAEMAAFMVSSQCMLMAAAAMLYLAAALDIGAEAHDAGQTHASWG